VFGGVDGYASALPGPLPDTEKLHEGRVATRNGKPRGRTIERHEPTVAARGDALGPRGRRSPPACVQSLAAASALLVVVDEHDGQFLSVHSPVALMAARQSSVSDGAHASKHEKSPHAHCARHDTTASHGPLMIPERQSGPTSEALSAAQLAAVHVLQSVGAVGSFSAQT
jgi:hypothetical protein